MILNRLKEFINKEGLTISTFEKSIGMSNASFGKSLRTGGAIGTDKLEKILKVYSDINPEWLLTGEGPMLKNDVTKTQSDHEIKAVAKHAKKTDEGIPLIPAYAMAGICSGDISVMDLDCERYIVPVFRCADFLIPVKGDSMNPKYHIGDIIACKKLQLNDLFFQWNKVYVLDTIQGPLVKRVAKGMNDDAVLLISENPDYKPFELHKSQIRAVALVMGIIRLE